MIRVLLICVALGFVLTACGADGPPLPVETEE